LNLPSVVNFINILRTRFTKFWRQKITKLKQKLQSRMFQLCNFWHQNISEKSVCKMLMKLTPDNWIKNTFKYLIKILVAPSRIWVEIFNYSGIVGLTTKKQELKSINKAFCKLKYTCTCDYFCVGFPLHEIF